MSTEGVLADWVASRFRPGCEWCAVCPEDDRLSLQAVPQPKRHEHVRLFLVTPSADWAWNITPLEFVALCEAVATVAIGGTPAAECVTTNENGVVMTAKVSQALGGKVHIEMYVGSKSQCNVFLGTKAAEWLCQPHVHIGRSPTHK